MMFSIYEGPYPDWGWGWKTTLVGYFNGPKQSGNQLVIFLNTRYNSPDSRLFLLSSMNSRTGILNNADTQKFANTSLNNKFADFLNIEKYYVKEAGMQSSCLRSNFNFY
jgi:hypothetical protein